MITHARLLELLQYDPATGLLTWRVSHGNKLAGAIAGTPMENGYLRVGVDGGRYLAHQLAWFYMTGEWEPELDHRDRHRSNNVFSNLRPSTRSQNQANRGVPKNNTSGIKGVTRYRDGRWQVEIWAQGKRHYLGRFDEIDAAALAYTKAARELFGAFAAN